MPAFSRRCLLSVLLLVGLWLPFLGKPVHIDDANFLTLARGAAADPWRPHAISVNWQGQSERAFDVLSNPPGIGWWLAPVAEASEPVMHAWMLPWLLLLAWGAWRLGRRFGGDGAAGVLVLGTAPVAVLAAQSLTPDLPLLALTAAGFGGYLVAVDRGRQGAAAGWAFVVGLGVLFRYSGVALLPLLLLYPLLRSRRPWAAVVGTVPLVLLMLHDLHAYGQLHLLAMTGFQSTASTGSETFRKLVAALAMMGGVGLLPVLAIMGRRAAVVGAALGGLLGVNGALLSQLPLAAALWTAILAAAGGAVMAGPFVGSWKSASSERRAERLFLAAWALGGLVFLLGLRFTAARYWLPFLPAVCLAWLALRPSRRLLTAAVALQVAVALGVAVDDLAMARVGPEAARLADLEARQCAQCGEPFEPERVFAGHWGWQHYLERRGWRPLEDEELLRPGTILAVTRTPWPQEPHESTCLEPLAEHVLPDGWPGPRVHTAAGFANLHAFVVAGSPPVETYAPWTFSAEPREWLSLYRVCGAPSDAGEPGSAAAERPAVDGPLNLLVFVVDALRADALQPWGQPRPTSPVLSRHARGALVFEHAWTPYTWTGPAFLSTMTARHARSHGWTMDWAQARERLPALGDDLPTLADVLGQAGFRTVGLQANPFLAWLDGDQLGFERWETMGDHLLLEAALEELAAWPDQEGPEFLYLHFMTNHEPLCPGRPAQEAVGVNIPVQALRGSSGPCPRGGFRQAAGNYPGLSEEQALRVYREAYLASARHADGLLGKVLDALTATGQAERTVVVFTSDHGELLGEHGQMGHGGWLWEPLTRIPLAIWGPGIPADRREDQVASLVDLGPTVLDALGLNDRQPGSWQGRSLLSDAGPGLVVSERDGGVASTLDGRWKLLEGPRAQRGTALYDLEADPGEAEDLLRANPAPLAALRAATTAWSTTTPTMDPEHVSRALTDEEREGVTRSLEALGYVE